MTHVCNKLIRVSLIELTHLIKMEAASDYVYHGLGYAIVTPESISIKLSKFL